MKKKYINPKIDEIRLDNEISLQLASPTAASEYEGYGTTEAKAPGALEETPDASPYNWDHQGW